MKTRVKKVYSKESFFNIRFCSPKIYFEKLKHKIENKMTEIIYWKTKIKQV